MKLLSSAAVRRSLVADPGYAIISADFDQIELRVAAGYAGETTLIEAAKRGESLHKIAAVKLFGEDYTPDQYRYTKNVNFGWLFGGGAFTLSRQAGIPYALAVEIIKQYESQFTALAKYKRRITNQVIRSALTPHEYRTFAGIRQQMFTARADTAEGKALRYQYRLQMERLCRNKIGWVRTAFGRPLPVDASKAYAGVNYIVQSTARDIMAGSFLRIMDDPELEPTVLLLIHDEILGQARKSKAEYTVRRYGEVMSTEFMGVPIDASGKVYGKSWGHGYMRKD